MQHHFILRYLRRPTHHDHRHYHPFTTTTSSVIPSITWVRDRALDHAVEKERDLKPITNLKNLIISEPSKSLPLSIITNNKTSLSIPNRPIDFIRKYPSLFHEYFPAGININIHPHVKLTPEILTLDAEEQVLFGSDVYKLDVANRLLKLLMLGRVNRIPLSVIDRFKWDLGLPNDYVESVVPHFPHYFRVVSNSNSNSNSNINDLDLELVCWNDELAVSVMEAKGTSEFKVQYSRGFELDKKFKKWVDEWQKLPYVSPYENVMSLGAKSEGSDKWVVGLMHEVLNILVPKKTEKDNLLVLGEFLGVRSRFKKALLEHPGIFYVSSKLRTHTVVLREGYKRDLLVEKVRHPVMKLRGSYIHLMNMVLEKSKAKDGEVGEKKQKATRDLDGEDDELSDDVSDEEEDDDDVSDEEEDDETEGVVDGESEDLEETQKTPIKRRTFEGRKMSDQRGSTRRSDESDESEDLEEMEKTPTKKTNLEGRKNPDQRGRVRRGDDNDESEDLDDGNTKIRGRTNRTGRFNDSNRRNTPNSRGNDNDGRRRRGNDRKYASDERSDFRTNRMSDRSVAKETNTPNSRGNDNDGRRGRGSDRKYVSDERSDGRVAKETNTPNSRGNDNDGRRGRGSDRKYASDERSDGRGAKETNRPYVRVNDNDGRRGRGNDRKYASDERSDFRTNRMSDRRGAKDTNPPRFLRTESPGARASRGRSSERPGFSRTREGGSSERSGAPRTREGRPSERSGVPRTREGRPSERSGVPRTREGRPSERSRGSRTREGRF